MSSSPNAQSPTSARAVPLGRLLIMRGLLTEQQLIEGLLEQDRTGDKLGKVLIRLGFVDPSSVALALASQHGGPLKTEYGFAIGFDAPTEPVTVPPLRSVPRPPSQPADGVVASERSTATEPPSQVDTMIAEPEAAQAELDAARMRIAGLEGELATAREQLDERRAKTAELEDTAASAHLAAEAELEAARTRIAGLEGELATAREQLDERRTKTAELEDKIASAHLASESELDAAHTRIAGLEGELAAAREQLDERRAKTAELEDRVADARLAAETAIAALQAVAAAPS